MSIRYIALQTALYGLTLIGLSVQGETANHKQAPLNQKVLTATRQALTCQLVTKRIPQPPSTEEWWGITDSSSHRNIYVVSSMKVSWKQKPVSIPTSAYSGIANPNVIRIHSTSGGYIIRITGGDAASSYVYRLTIKRLAGEYVAVRREVEHGELPEYNEVTTYHYALSSPNIK